MRLRNIMDENAPKSAQQETIERFYYQGWNKKNTDVITSCLDPAVRFRSATGKKRQGVAAVVEHVNQMHATLGRHTRIIEDLVDSTSAENKKCAVRIKCTGVHQNEFFGVPGTGHEITWCNAAFFTFNAQGLISEIYVLGDMDSIKRQIGASPDAPPFPK